MAKDDHRLRCGDVARHRSTRANFIVVAADYTAGLVWSHATPVAIYPIDDVMLLKICSDEEHVKWVKQWHPGATVGDKRQQKVAELYSAALKPKASAEPPPAVAPKPRDEVKAPSLE